MSQTIEGTYRNGVVSLDRLPDGVTEARVAVAFVDPPRAGRTGRRRGIAHFGMFAPADGAFTSDDELERVKKSWNPRPDEWDV